MLILAVKRGESVVVGDSVKITLSKIDPVNNNIRLGITAPKEVKVLRSELIKWTGEVKK